MNYYERHIGDYLKDTVHLSLLEHGIYGRLLDIYYTRESALPAEQVMRLVGARTDEERSAVRDVLNEFFTEEDGLFKHSRCDREIARYQEKSEKAKKSAQASVQSRRATSEMTNREIRSARMREAREKGRHTDDEWSALREFCGFKCVRCGSDGHQDRDHILPVYQGGSDGIDNIQPLCARCNASKGSESADHRPSGWRAFVERSLSVRSALQTPDTRHQTPDPEINTNTACATDAGRVCVSFKAHGINDVNPGHPGLLSLIAAGATDEEFIGAASTAKERGKGFAYAIGMLKRQRAEAAQPPPTRAGPQEPEWRK